MGVLSKTQIIVGAIGLLCFSCGTPKYIQQSFSYCYSDTIQKDLPMRTDGVYVVKYPVFYNAEDTTILDTLLSTILFYNNGICAYGFFETGNIAEKNNAGYRDIKYYTDSLGYVQSKLFFLDKIATGNGEYSNNYFHSISYFYYSKKTNWGKYMVQDSIIKIQMLEYPLYAGHLHLHLWEIGYKIIDKNTILELYEKMLAPHREEERNKDYGIFDNPPAIFIPVQNIPPSERSWIFREKWFWCNDNEWKRFMKRY